MKSQIMTNRPRQVCFITSTPRGILFVWALSVLMLTTSACRSPEYRERRTFRDRRIEQLVESAPELQRHRRTSLERVFSDAETMRERRWDHLEQTITWAEEVEQTRRDRCRRDPLETQPWFRNILTGHPEHIPRTWADMVY